MKTVLALAGLLIVPLGWLFVLVDGDIEVFLTTVLVLLTCIGSAAWVFWSIAYLTGVH